jgi:hypothetical protein
MDIQDHADDLRKDMLKRPEYFAYHGDLDLDVWGFSPICRTRDSGLREISNFEVITADMLKRFPKSCVIARFGHWGPGWIEQLMVKTTSKKAMLALTEWVLGFENDPVADSMDLYEREQQACEESWDNWAEREVTREMSGDPRFDFLKPGDEYDDLELDVQQIAIARSITLGLMEHDDQSFDTNRVLYAVLPPLLDLATLRELEAKLGAGDKTQVDLFPAALRSARAATLWQIRALRKSLKHFDLPELPALNDLTRGTT